jgi:hypothetical protein
VLFCSDNADGRFNVFFTRVLNLGSLVGEDILTSYDGLGRCSRLNILEANERCSCRRRIQFWKSQRLIYTKFINILLSILEIDLIKSPEFKEVELSSGRSSLSNKRLESVGSIKETFGLKKLSNDVI